MDLVVPIPDDLAQRLSVDGETIERRVLEAFAAEEFRLERLTRHELKRLLGFATRGELDAFLTSRGIFGCYTEEDLDSDRADLRTLGL